MVVSTNSDEYGIENTYLQVKQPVRAFGLLARVSLREPFGVLASSIGGRHNWENGTFVKLVRLRSALAKNENTRTMNGGKWDFRKPRKHRLVQSI